MRPQQRAVRRICELGRDAHFIPRTQERAGDDQVDVRLDADLVRIHRSVRESGRRHAGTHDERLQAAERAGERLRQAEGQELNVRVGPQHAERQHDQARHRRRLRRLPRRHRHQEPVAAARQCLDEPWRVGGIAQRLTNLADAEVQPLLEVHERVAAPDVIADLAARDHLAAAAREELEHLERLRRQLDQVAALAKLAGRRIQLERAKAQDETATHRKLIEISARLNGRGQAAAAL